MQWREAGSAALLIPGIWLAIIASRPVSNWFGPGAADSSVEGRPINTIIFAVLIGLAVFILSKRGFIWSIFFRQNKALIAVYLYFALSMAWSDLPLVSLKRLIKDFGCVLIVLVFLTERRPVEAIRAVVVRVAYFLLPLSLVLGKYFPAIGRNFSVSGEPMFTGVTTQKNSLGQLLVAFGLILWWDLLNLRKLATDSKAAPRVQLWIHIAMLVLAAWLIMICDSQTSLVCLLLGIFAFWSSGRLLRMANGKQILVLGLISLVVLWALDQSLGVSDALIRALGRNPTLTGRTDIWRIVLEQQTSPFFGEGFYIFWDTAKGYATQMLVRAPIQSSHNGYIEMYLDGGFLGIALVGIFLFAGSRRTISRLFDKVPLGRIGFVFSTVAIVYNLSESSLFRLDALWLTFLLFTVEYPQRNFQTARPVFGYGSLSHVT